MTKPRFKRELIQTASELETVHRSVAGMGQARTFTSKQLSQVDAVVMGHTFCGQPQEAGWISNRPGT